MTSGKKIGLALGVVAALGLAGVAAFYSVTGDAGNGSCSAAAKTAARMAPLAKGEVAAIEVRSAPQPAPELAFTGPDGKPLTLADFKGRTILVNLWATWCAPCLKEMPALDKLEKEMGGPDFAVVAINIDTRNLDKPKAWLAENKVDGAQVERRMRALKSVGDPYTDKDIAGAQAAVEGKTELDAVVAYLQGLGRHAPRGG